MVRVLWITSEYHPRTGGIEAYVERAADSLAERCAVGLITGTGQHPKTAQRVTHVASLNLAYAKTVAEFAQVVDDLVRLVQDFRPTVIHLASAGLAVFAHRLDKIAPIVCTVHCKDLTEPWQRAPGRDVRLEIRQGLRRCSDVICVSRYTQVFLNSLVPEVKSRVIRPGIKLPAQISVTGSSAVPRVITVSRLIQRKGHILLAAALATVQCQFHWDIVGEGLEQETIRNCISHLGLSGKTQMHGRICDEKLHELLALASLFVLTPVEVKSETGIDAEGFGLVYLEAAAHELPVIGSAASAAEEIVLPGVTGLLVDPHNREVFADALAYMLGNPDRCKSMGLAARRHVESEFGIDRQICDIESVYRALGSEGLQ
jgi:glycosyltransferase involved in cell wall biosynthesis